MLNTIKKSKPPYLLTLIRVSLAVFLFISSSIIIYVTAQNYYFAQVQATQALKNTALALSFSAESALRASGNKAGDDIRGIFSDRVVAYALIAGKEGKILFHTNQRLVGSYLPDMDGQKWPSDTISGRRIELGTGLPAYEFNYIINNSDKSDELLRLVIHTTSADRIVSNASRMWWTVGGVLFLLWVIGIMFDRIFMRHLRLQEELNRRNQLVLIGQMTAVLAHEIRNSLGSIKGYVQWVNEKLIEPDPKKAGLSIVLRGVDRIEALVNDLLLFSREENYDIECFDIAILVGEAINSIAHFWKGKVHLEIKPGTMAMGDREKLYRVLLNGIRNSIQAMKDEGSLRILSYKDGQWILIRIEDTGHGIPDEEFSSLFTPFHTTKTDGTGLGLAYSKKVVEGMGGKISLVNQDGRNGAILTIQLPKAGKSNK